MAADHCVSLCLSLSLCHSLSAHPFFSLWACLSVSVNHSSLQLCVCVCVRARAYKIFFFFKNSSPTVFISPFLCPLQLMSPLSYLSPSRCQSVYFDPSIYLFISICFGSFFFSLRGCVSLCFTCTDAHIHTPACLPSLGSMGTCKWDKGGENKQIKLQSRLFTDRKSVV